MAEGSRVCPHCAEDVRPQARVCPHCRRSLAPNSQYNWIAWAVAAALIAFILYSYFDAQRNARSLIDSLSGFTVWL